MSTQNVENKPENYREMALIHILVGGVPFVLDFETVSAFGSEFLTALVDPDSHFKKPEDGVYRVDADAECFSAFLHCIRFGDIPFYAACQEKDKLMLSQADFWGIQERVKMSFPSVNHIRSLFQKASKLHTEAARSSTHHNCHSDCNIGGTMEVDHYTNCNKRRKGITFNRALGWCHKCSLCLNCQKSRCPNDNRSTYSDNASSGKTTEQLYDEIRANTTEFEKAIRGSFSRKTYSWPSSRRWRRV
mmetsp:Transcript_42257/g.82941  ORF Transcript_42257/g.82941 Transcript_42257/m.82941 type:complete len:246 (-) Transcript_42257:23-760(-)